MGSSAEHDMAGHEPHSTRGRASLTSTDPGRDAGTRRRPRVFLIRHAHADGPKDPDRGRHLSDVGRRQAEALARRMAAWQLDAIVCSDTYRALETASAVHALRPEIPLVVDAT